MYDTITGVVQNPPYHPPATFWSNRSKPSTTIDLDQVGSTQPIVHVHGSRHTFGMGVGGCFFDLVPITQQLERDLRLLHSIPKPCVGRFPQGPQGLASQFNPSLPSRVSVPDTVDVWGWSRLAGLQRSLVLDWSPPGNRAFRSNDQ